MLPIIAIGQEPLSALIATGSTDATLTIAILAHKARDRAVGNGLEIRTAIQ